MATKEELTHKLAQAIVDMEVDEAEAVAKAITDAGWFSMDLLEKGIAAGMGEASQYYEDGEYFIPELLSCADAAEAATDVFRPYMQGQSPEPKGRVIIGAICGDTHDIGKNIVALVIQAAGYEVIDLGRDVPAQDFVAAAEREQADVIAIASLMTTSMNHMADVIQLLEKRGIRDRYGVIVGGKPISASFAREIGADRYAASAGAAVRIIDEWMQAKKQMQVAE